ncbi:MAG: DUF2007 domain-containing protein [Alphaproteobacteria bacterium]|nr:DUF2007 domain-containing protein [Alphaproteobacteria bacterium SS10]
MRAVYTTNDPVALSWLESVLVDAGFDAVILDVHTSILEGSIGAIPRRLAVIDEDYDAAKRLVDEALADIAGNPGNG